MSGRGWEWSELGRRFGPGRGWPTFLRVKVTSAMVGDSLAPVASALDISEPGRFLGGHFLAESQGGRASTPFSEPTVAPPCRAP